MNIADIVLLGSLVVLVPALLIKQTMVRSVCVILSALMLYVMHHQNQTVSSSLLIGIIAGAIFQPFLADPFLVPRTLRYEESKFKIRMTPWWMVILWGIAVTQLFYAWFRIEGLTSFTPVSYSLFVISGWLYFLVFELIVNNWSKWWTRHDCYQLFNVAVYAMIAEAFTVAAIPLASHFFLDLQEVSLRTTAAIVVGISYGCFVVAAFTGLCAIEYYKLRRLST